MLSSRQRIIVRLQPAFRRWPAMWWSAIRIRTNLEDTFFWWGRSSLRPIFWGIGPSGDRAVGRSGHREIGSSGDRVIGRSDHRAIRPSFLLSFRALLREESAVLSD